MGVLFDDAPDLSQFAVKPKRSGGGSWWTPKRVDQAVNHLKTHAGLSHVGAHGLVSRWKNVEAGGGPSATNPNSGAFGIAQWLGSRKNGVPTDFEGQLNHVVKELNGSESAAAKRLRTAQTPDEAATGASMYERAEGYNPKTGRDNFTNATVQGMRNIGVGSDVPDLSSFAVKNETAPDLSSFAVGDNKTPDNTTVYGTQTLKSPPPADDDIIRIDSFASDHSQDDLAAVDSPIKAVERAKRLKDGVPPVEQPIQPDIQGGVGNNQPTATRPALKGAKSPALDKTPLGRLKQTIAPLVPEQTSPEQDQPQIPPGPALSQDETDAQNDAARQNAQFAANPAPDTFKRTIDFRDKPDNVDNREWVIQHLVPEIASKTGFEAIDIEKQLRVGFKNTYGTPLQDIQKGGDWTFEMTPDFAEAVVGRGEGKRNALANLIATGQDITDADKEKLSRELGLDPQEIDAALAGQGGDRYKDALTQGKATKEAYETLAQRYGQSLADDEPSSVAAIRAAYDVGWADNIDEAIANEKDIYRRLLTEERTGADLDLSGISQARFGTGTVGKDFNPGDPKYSGKSAVDAIIKQYGTLANYKREQDDLREKYRYRPLTAPLEFAKRFGNALPQVAASLVKTLAIAGELVTYPLNKLSDTIAGTDFQTQFSAENSPVYKLGKQFGDYFDNLKNHDFDKVQLISTVPDALGQITVQLIAGMATGGASLPTAIGAAMGADQQYEDAAKFTKSPEARLIAALAGAAAAVPDAFAFNQWFGKLGNAEKTTFLNNLTKSIYSRLGLKVGDEAAEELTKVTMQTWIKNLAKGGAFEGAQEVSENKINDAVALATFDASEARKQHLLAINDEDIASFLGGLVGGLAGGAVETKIEQANLGTLEQAETSLPNLLAQNKIDQQHFDAVMPLIKAEIDRRYQKVETDKKPLGKREVKAAIKSQLKGEIPEEFDPLTAFGRSKDTEEVGPPITDAEPIYKGKLPKGAVPIETFPAQKDNTEPTGELAATETPTTTAQPASQTIEAAPRPPITLPQGLKFTPKGETAAKKFLADKDVQNLLPTLGTAQESQALDGLKKAASNHGLTASETIAILDRQRTENLKPKPINKLEFSKPNGGESIAETPKETPPIKTQAEVDKENAAIAQGQLDELNAKKAAEVKEPESVPVKPSKSVPALKVSTERGTDAGVKPKVIDASDLVTSLDEGYPAELQPRDRSRAASKAQISDIANKLKPEFLDDSPKASDGRPLVVPMEIDGKQKYVVISGNGRTAAIKHAYALDNEPSKAYAEFTQGKAANEFKQPVYVGELDPNEIDLQQFTREANESATAQMSSTEQAKVDAEKVDTDLMGLFVPSEDGSIHSAANRDFIRGFLQKAVAKTDQGTLVDEQGQLSQEGMSRVRNAIFAKVYGENAVKRLAESVDSNVKRATNALLKVAPKFAMLNDLVASGDRHPGLAISHDVAAALDKFAVLKEKGTDVETYIQQQGLFGDDLTPFQKRILVEFDNYRTSSAALSGILNNYIELANELGNPKQTQLFGEPVEANAPILFERAVLDYSNGREADTTQTSLFDADQGRESKPRAETSSPRQEDSGESAETPLQSVAKAPPVGTPEFKNWFKDSKVVDSDGEPLVVYHGTGDDIEVFDHNKAQDAEGRRLRLGEGKGKFYFTDNSAVASFAATEAPNRGLGSQPNIVPVYLSVQKPITLMEYHARFEDIGGGQKIRGDVLTDEQRDQVIAELDRELKEEGYDGIIRDENDFGTVAVFSPNQIKSAIGNRGTFDPNEDSILKKVRTAEGYKYLTEELPAMPTGDLVAKVTGGQLTADNDLELSPEDAEFLRRLQADYSGGKDVKPFDGALWRPGAFETLVPHAKAKYQEAIDAEFTPDELAGFDNLIKNLEKLAAANENTGVVYVFEDSLPEEKTHQEDAQAGSTDEQARKMLDDSPFMTDPGDQFTEEYGGYSRNDKMAEVFAKLATNQEHHYGWDAMDDFEEAKESFLDIYADGILRNNGVLTQEQFEAFAEKYKRLNYGTLKKGLAETGEDNLTEAAADERGVEDTTETRGPPAEEEEQVPGSTETAEGEQPDVSEEGGGVVRERKTVLSAEKHGIVGVDEITGKARYYRQKSSDDRTARAQAKIERLGLESATTEAMQPITDLKTADEQNAFRKEVVKLLNRLAREADTRGDGAIAVGYRAARKQIVEAMAETGTQGGRFIQSMDWRDKDDADTVVDYVNASRRREGYGVETTEAENKALETGADELVKAQTKIDSLEAKLAELEAQMKGPKNRPLNRAQKSLLTTLRENSDNALKRIMGMPLQSIAQSGEDAVEKGFKKWRRANITYRGISDAAVDGENNRSGMLGRGLYTAHSGNRGMTKEYGKMKLVANARPKNPKVFSDLNQWQIWEQNNLYPKDANGFPDARLFDKQGKTIEGEMQKMGYDGIEIKGREIVNFKPEGEVYFDNERQARQYYEAVVHQDDDILASVVQPPDQSLQGQILNDLSDVGAAILFNGFNDEDIITPEQFETEFNEKTGGKYAENWRQVHAESMAKLKGLRADARRSAVVDRVKSENLLLSDEEVQAKADAEIASEKAANKERAAVRGQHTKLANEILLANTRATRSVEKDIKKKTEKELADVENTKAFLDKAATLDPNATDDVLALAAMLDDHPAMSTQDALKFLRNISDDYKVPADASNDAIKKVYDKTNTAIGQAKKLRDKVAAENKKQAEIAKGQSDDVKEQLAAAKRERLDNRRGFDAMVSRLEKPPASAVEKATQLQRMMMVSAINTAANNLVSGLATRGMFRFVDVFDTGIQKLGRKLGRDLKDEGITADTRWADVLGLPQGDEAGFKTYFTQLATAHNSILAALDEHPELFNEIYGDYSSDIKNPEDIDKRNGAIHTVLDAGIYAYDKLNFANRWQEYAVRDLEAFYALQVRLGQRGLDFETLKKDGKLNQITMEDWRFAIDRARKVTYALRPERGSTADRVLRELNSHPVPAVIIAPFAKFSWNVWNMTRDWLPIAAQLRAGRRVTSEEGARFRDAFNPKNYSSRELANNITGFIFLAAALGLVRALGDRDDWYYLRVPYSEGMGRTSAEYPNGAPLYIDMRQHPEFAPFLYMANKLNRIIEGKDMFNYDDPKTIASEIGEVFLSLSYRQAIDQNAIIQSAGYGIDAAIFSADREKNAEKAWYLLTKFAGDRLGMAFSPLRPLKNITDSLSKSGDLDMDAYPFTQGFERSMPKYIFEKAGIPTKKDAVTGAPKQFNPYQWLKPFGLNIVDDQIAEPEMSQTVRTAKKLEFSDPYVPPITAEEKNARDTKRDIYKAMDVLRKQETPDMTDKQKDELYKPITDALKRAVDENVLRQGQADYIEQSIGKAQIESLVKRGSLPNGLTVYKTSLTDDKIKDTEREAIKDIIQSKINRSEKMTAEDVAKAKKLGFTMVEVPMPDDVRKEFDKFDLEAPGTGQDLTLQKGGPKTHLSQPADEKYRTEVLKQVYAAITETLKDPNYQKATPEEKKLVLTRIISKTRNAGREEAKADALEPVQ